MASEIENVTPLRYDEADQSVKRQPSDITTSALAAVLLPGSDPGQPAVPAHIGLSSAIAPFPFQVKTTGMPSFSTNVVNSGVAFALIAPPPTTMHGRLAVRSSLIAASIALVSARGFPIGKRVARSATSMSVVSTCTSS